MICPQCGKEASGHFCSECGARLPQEPPEAQPVAPVGAATPTVPPTASSGTRSTGAGARFLASDARSFAFAVKGPASPLLAQLGLICPVCAAQAMHETDVKGLFHTKRELVCGRCGSVFVDHEGRGERFQLSDTLTRPQSTGSATSTRR